MLRNGTEVPRGPNNSDETHTTPACIFFVFFSWDPTAAARPIHNFSIGKKYDRQKNSYQQSARTYHGVIDRLPQTNDFFTPTRTVVVEGSHRTLEQPSRVPPTH
jgi:hypothetical protein